jgi:hypothetical protein
MNRLRIFVNYGRKKFYNIDTGLVSGRGNVESGQAVVGDGVDVRLAVGEKRPDDIDVLLNYRQVESRFAEFVLRVNERWHFLNNLVPNW